MPPSPGHSASAPLRPLAGLLLTRKRAHQIGEVAKLADLMTWHLFTSIRQPPTALCSKHWGVRVFDCVRRSSGCDSTVLNAGTLARCARRAIWPSGEGTVGCGCWSRAVRPFALRPACPSCSLARAAPPAAVPSCGCAIDPQPPAGALLTLGSGFMRRPSVGLWRRLLR